MLCAYVTFCLSSNFISDNRFAYSLGINTVVIKLQSSANCNSRTRNKISDEDDLHKRVIRDKISDMRFTGLALES